MNWLINNFIERLKNVDISKLTDEELCAFKNFASCYLLSVLALGNMDSDQLNNFIKRTFEQFYPGVECSFINE